MPHTQVLFREDNQAAKRLEKSNCVACGKRILLWEAEKTPCDQLNFLGSAQDCARGCPVPYKGDCLTPLEGIEDLWLAFAPIKGFT